MNQRQLREKDYQTYINDLYQGYVDGKSIDELNKIKYGRLRKMNTSSTIVWELESIFLLLIFITVQSSIIINKLGGY
jgi:hypothetical protein